MAEPPRDFIRYLSARHKEASRVPRLTQSQLAVYEHLLETARSEPERLEEEAGDMLSVARAELSDLHRGWAHVYGLFPFQLRSEAHTRAAQLIESARTHAELAGFQGRISEESGDAARRESEIRFHLVDLFNGLTGWRSARPAAKAGFAELANSAWQKLAAIDPGFGWQKIRTHLPYRAITPYSDEHLSLFESWFLEMSR